MFEQVFFTHDIKDNTLCTYWLTFVSQSELGQSSQDSKLSQSLKIQSKKQKTKTNKQTNNPTPAQNTPPPKKKKKKKKEHKKQRLVFVSQRIIHSIAPDFT